MLVVSILTRRVKQGKTYDDFRKAWYHTVGFGNKMKMYSAINAFNTQEIIVIGMGEINSEEDAAKVARIEVKERLDHSLDDVIEPEIGRTFGIVVSEDDFSPSGKIEYRPASINGKETDFAEVAQGLALAKKILTIASEERDEAKAKKSAAKKIEKNSLS